jgi:Na+-driven multidrug efflux pump
VSQWVLQFPLALILGSYTSLGLEGVWWAFPISSVLTTLGAAVFFMRGDWKQGRLTESEKAVEQATEEILVEEGVR